MNNKLNAAMGSTIQIHTSKRINFGCDLVVTCFSERIQVFDLQVATSLNTRQWHEKLNEELFFEMSSQYCH